MGKQFYCEQCDLLMTGKQAEKHSHPMPSDTKWLDKAVEDWIAQSRSEEQIRGVRNFLTGLGRARILTHLEKRLKYSQEEVDLYNQIMRAGMVHEHEG